MVAQSTTRERTIQKEQNPPEKYPQEQNPQEQNPQEQNPQISSNDHPNNPVLDLGLISNLTVHWVCFQGSYNFASLVKELDLLKVDGNMG